LRFGDRRVHVPPQTDVQVSRRAYIHNRHE
jgi:hypothetical protein